VVGEEFERKVPLEGPANFRDVGGYDTADGEQRVRTGVVYRSDSLSRVTVADAEVLARIGVRTAIDLRTLDEVDRTPPALLEHLQAAYQHVPIIDEGGAAAERPKDFVFPELHVAYAGMLDRFGGNIARAIELVASSPKAVVFYCEAGKDRTGLVAALLLSLLGVNDSDVAADYALTTGALPVIVDRVRDERTFDPEHHVPDHALTSEEATMLATLEALRERYGSVEVYLGVHGLDESVPDLLRAELLARRAFA
jgi:protein tyrosine/serine phosphatase